ncbi:hypothetical protein [Enterococcus hulanensis]|uniref:hypothetical protein n=1 Tax=Enterococcus hulanensis TaxID=2559929 RepID=UPI0010F4D645|nr:hypothetical protein [Enterococcus hulanensis]
MSISQLEKRYRRMEELLNKSITQELIEQNKMELLGIMLAEWIDIAIDLNEHNKRLIVEIAQLKLKVDKENRNNAIGYKQVISLMNGLKLKNKEIEKLKQLLEVNKNKKTGNFHTPGSGRKVHAQTIRGVLLAYKNNEKTKFINNNKNISRATFYNIVGRKYKSDKYNDAIDRIANELGVILPDKRNN